MFWLTGSTEQVTLIDSEILSVMKCLPLQSGFLVSLEEVPHETHDYF